MPSAEAIVTGVMLIPYAFAAWCGIGFGIVRCEDGPWSEVLKWSLIGLIVALLPVFVVHMSILFAMGLIR